jgi:hypothetical protein
VEADEDMTKPIDEPAGPPPTPRHVQAVRIARARRSFRLLREQMRLEREIEELNALRDEDGASRAG